MKKVVTATKPKLRLATDALAKGSSEAVPSPASRAFAAKPAVIKLDDEDGRLRALNRLEILDSPPEHPFEKIVELVCEVLNVPICAVSLVDQDRQWFKAYRGLAVSETTRDISFCTHAIQHPEPYIVEDAARAPLFADNPLVTGAPNIRSYAGAQLKTKDGFAIGTLCAIDTIPRAFSEAEIAILTKFASLVSNDIEMREMASYDTLTGTLCRRTWLDCAMHEVYSARRSQAPIAVFMIDIDHFKRVNDRFGHVVGDTVLKAVAETAEAELRKSDWFGRYGGEEFVAALPGSNFLNALAIAERLRTAVAAMRLPCIDDYRCTISIGVADVGTHESDIGYALERADQALLRAKKDGRNRVQAATSAAAACRVAS